jgi:hypothetical protein
MLETPVITDRRVLANRPDRVLHDKKEETYSLIYMVVSGDSNLNRK